MCGMVLVHIAGRMTTGLLSEDAQHLCVLAATLVLLAGMGLLGRNDLGLRIPSALEAVVGLLVIDRGFAFSSGAKCRYRLPPTPSHRR